MSIQFLVQEIDEINELTPKIYVKILHQELLEYCSKSKDATLIPKLHNHIKKLIHFSGIIYPWYAID